MANSPPNPRLRPNPYVGPRAFQTGETLYGRGREINELLDLLIAERIVLLHSPSGAGKSSLVHAGLVPRLHQEGFMVLPVVRVSQERPVELLKGDSTLDLNKYFNRYLFSTMLSLEEALPAAEHTPLPFLARTNLENYLKMLIPKVAKRNKEELAGADQPDSDQDREGSLSSDSDSAVLIFDQFEEILTTELTDRDAKLAFFQQLGDTLRDRSRWALFIMREDYLAALDPFVRPVPTRFSNTYRLDLLTAAAARQAVQGPARSQGVDFTDSASSRLIDDLRKVMVQQADGSLVEQPGPYVEPVQLQVVCFRLWQELPPDQDSITENELAGVGNVSQSLAEYYAESVAAISTATGVSERKIRQWAETNLITEHGNRGQVQLGQQDSNGLANSAVRGLENSHLIRSEKRLGATWFELAHDRLIQPVLQDNAEWYQTHLSLMERQAALWAKDGRPERLLLRADSLVEAEIWAAEHPEELTDIDRDFLSACQELRDKEMLEIERLEQAAKLESAQKLAETEKQRAEEKARTAVRLRSLLMVAVIAAVAALVLAGAAAFFGSQAVIQRSAAVSARLLAEDNAAKAEANRVVAVSAAAAAQTAQAAEAVQRATADAASALAETRKATAEAASQLAIDNAKLAEEQKATAVYNEQIARVQAGLATSRQLAALSTNYATSHPELVYLLSIAAYRTADTSEARGALLDTLQQNLGRTLKPYQPAPPSSKEPVYSVAISPDGNLIAWGDDKGGVNLWNSASGKSVQLTGQGHEGIVRALDFSPDGKLLASGGDDGWTYLWDLASGQQVGKLQADDPVYTLDWAPQELGPKMVIGARPKIIIWDTTKPLSTGTLISSLGRQVRDVAWSPDGQTIATATDDVDILLLDPTNLAKIGQLKGHQKQVLSVDWSPDSQRLVSGSADRFVRLWDVPNRQPIGEPMKLHLNDVGSVSFSQDGSLVASGSNDNSAAVWDTKTQAWKEHLTSFKSSVTGVTFSPAGAANLLLIGSRDRTVGLYEVSSEQPLSALVVSTSGLPAALGFDASDALLAAIREGNAWNMLKIQDSAVISSPLTLNGTPVVSAIGGDGALAAFGEESGAVQVLEWANPAAQAVEVKTPRGLVSMAFTPDGKILATAHCSKPKGRGLCDQQEIYQWDAVGQVIGQPLVGAAIQNGAANPGALAYHPAGTILAAASGNGILFWNLATGQPVGFPLADGTAAVTSLAFSPDGKHLSAGYLDETITIWDVASSQPIGGPLTGAAGKVLSLVYSTDGLSLFSGNEPGAIYEWDINPESWIERACALAKRDLTPEEVRYFIPDAALDFSACAAQ